MCVSVLEFAPLSVLPTEARGGAHPLKLELQMVVSCSVPMGSKPGPFKKQEVFLTAESSLHPTPSELWAFWHLPFRLCCTSGLPVLRGQEKPFCFPSSLCEWLPSVLH